MFHLLPMQGMLTPICTPLRILSGHDLHEILFFVRLRFLKVLVVQLQNEFFIGLNRVGVHSTRQLSRENALPSVGVLSTVVVADQKTGTIS